MCTVRLVRTVLVLALTALLCACGSERRRSLGGTPGNTGTGNNANNGNNNGTDGGVFSGDAGDGPCVSGGCGLHGICVDGSCRCESGWIGARCEHEDRPCQSGECGNHGICVKGTCSCESGWTGRRCERMSENPNPGECSTNDQCGDQLCLNGVCTSEAVPCGNRACPVNHACVDGSCVPNTNMSCSHSDECRRNQRCIKGTCEWNASCGGPCYNGSCEDSICYCDSGWMGNDCNTEYRCIEEVNCINGSCNDNECRCFEGWHGRQCNAPTVQCNDMCINGSCKGEKCLCHEGFCGTWCDSGCT